MMRICLIAGLLMIELLAVVDLATAANTRNLSREEIRGMPLVQRPNRIGHVYGNNVRRLHRIAR